MSGEVRTPERAFVLRIAPSGVDRVQEALESGDLIIGWSEVTGLTNPDLSWQEFRQIIHDTYTEYREAKDYRRSGSAAGSMWRFIRDMQVGDWVVVPHGPEFYVAEITGPVRYDETRVDQDTAYRRAVKWLNHGKPIQRRQARANLRLRMKIQQACADATDRIDEITEVLRGVEEGRPLSFEEDVRRRVVEEIRSGRLDERQFEELVKKLLLALGAHDARVVPPRQDRGADVVAEFQIAKRVPLRLAAQAKHYKPEPPVGPEVVNQLAEGMRAEAAQLGLVVTSGSISEEAEDRATELSEEEGIRIGFIDGTELAKLIIENWGKVATG